MKKLLVVIVLIVAIASISSSQTGDTNISEKVEKVVINHEMIERFNAVQYTENTMNYSDLITSYSMSDLKLVYHIYHQDTLNFSNKTLLDQKLAEVNAAINNPTESIRVIIPLYTSK